MTAVVRPGLAIVMLLALAGCSLPRGAALQSEVLAVAEDDRGVAVGADFGVVDVTRSTLLTIAEWPGVGLGGYPWIDEQQPASLLIAPGDKIVVTVWDADENSLLSGPGQRAVTLQEMQVSSSGEVFLPFVGSIRIEGMSQSSARERIEERYSETIPSAQVQLVVTPGRANTANLVAGVAAPGVYPLQDRNVTILTLLSLGGGVDPDLRNPQVRLFRGNDVFGIALDRLYDDPALDTTLTGGDRVIVEAEDRVFLALGAAGVESRYPFPQDVVTGLDALSIIGGINDQRANPQGILVLRDYPVRAVDAAGRDGPPQERMVFIIDLTSADGLFSAGNFRIMPNDLIYVSESPLTVTGTVLGLISSIFGLTQQARNL